VEGLLASVVVAVPPVAGAVVLGRPAVFSPAVPVTLGALSVPEGEPLEFCSPSSVLPKVSPHATANIAVTVTRDGLRKELLFMGISVRGIAQSSPFTKRTQTPGVDPAKKNVIPQDRDRRAGRRSPPAGFFHDSIRGTVPVPASRADSGAAWLVETLGPSASALAHPTAAA
jgi:hypothetical protein